MVSESTVLVVAGIMPIDLLTQEWKQVYMGKAKVGKIQAHREAIAHTMAEYQERWTTRRTRSVRLIKQLACGHVDYQWTDSKHGEINLFHNTISNWSRLVPDLPIWGK